MSSNKQASTDADGAEEVVQRFWGMTLAPGKDFTLTLTRTELHLTQACVTAEDSSATLTVSTPQIKNVTLATLAMRGLRQTLLDVSFFPGDESVTFRAEGAPVHLAGSIAIFGGILMVSDDEDEEAEPVASKKGSKAATKPAAAK